MDSCLHRCHRVCAQLPSRLPAPYLDRVRVVIAMASVDDIVIELADVVRLVDARVNAGIATADDPIATNLTDALGVKIMALSALSASMAVNLTDAV